MKLLDSNILIYAPQPSFSHLRPLLTDTYSAVSEMAILEVLGYHQLTAAEKLYFETLFNNIKIIPIDRIIIIKAVELRQLKRMSIGDAVHAATALIYAYTLYTRNDSDFKWITGLSLINPV